MSNQLVGFKRMEESHEPQNRLKKDNESLDIFEDIGDVSIVRIDQEFNETLVNLGTESSAPNLPMIVHRMHAPEWLVDNEYILHGYRVHFGRGRDLLKSLFMRHNELLNIWTHLIGGIIFVALVIYVIFYFDVFSSTSAKMRQLLNSKTAETLKEVIPNVLKKIE